MRRLLVLVVVGYAVTIAILMAVVPTGAGLWPFAIMTSVFAPTVWVLARARLAPRATAVVIIGVAALLQLLMLTRSPLTSDDANRYAWDAKVQLSGTDPYRYAPQAGQLEKLREPALFGPSSACTYPVPGGCTAINRPAVRTIYPPVAQVAFDAGRVLSFGGHGGLLVYQALGAIGALVISALLTRAAVRRRQAVWPVALWAWCPIVLSEFGNNGHLDWLAVILTLLALESSAAGRPRWAGVLLGAAIVTKLYPALALPALLRKQPWVVAVATATTVVLSYVPHVLAVGGQVIGYLPGYLHEEGYESGSRLLLLGAVLPHPFDTAVGGLMLIAAGWWAWRKATPDAPQFAAVGLIGIAFLVTTPGYGWYAGLLLALAVLTRRFEWIPVAFAPSVVYLVHDQWWRTAAYALALLAMLMIRRRRICTGPETAEPPARVLTNVGMTGKHP